MRVFFLILLVIHGAIHLLGFVKAFNLASRTQLSQNISKSVGLLWLLTSLLFLSTAVLYFIEKDVLWISGAAAILISQILIILHWQDGRYGTIANIILIVPVIVSLASSQPTSYKSIFQTIVMERMGGSSSSEILAEDDIANLPIPVQKYIRYSGAIGKHKVRNFRAEFNGQLKPKPDSDFLDFRAVQYNFYDEPARAFYIESQMFGLPFDALHLYIGSKATMQVKIASLVQVVDAQGPEMNKSETVTMFNDMCFLAPATLIAKNITWKSIDSLTVKATFSNRGNTISAILFFNEKGELIDFSSNDRYESADGKVYNNYQWTTPLKEYQDFNGRKVASYGEANWHKPEGEFCYGKFYLQEIEYNCDNFK